MTFLFAKKKKTMAIVNAINLIIVATVIAISITNQVYAQEIDENLLGLPYAENLALGDNDPRDIAVNIIEILLGFMAIVVVMLIMLGGFKWMIASGNEDKLLEARNTITSAIVGLIIILAAWGITNFLIRSILEATMQ